MKKIFSLLMAIAIFASLHASTSLTALPTAKEGPAVEIPVLNANEIMLPVGKTGKLISLMALAEISVKDYESIRGKKLGFFKKIGFRLGQQKLRNGIDTNGRIKSKLITRYAGKIAYDGEGGFHLGGFALGFLLPVIGVLIAYLINDDYKSDRVKWAWIGLSVFASAFTLLYRLVLNDTP